MRAEIVSLAAPADRGWTREKLAAFADEPDITFCIAWWTEHESADGRKFVVGVSPAIPAGQKPRGVALHLRRGVVAYVRVTGDTGCFLCGR